MILACKYARENKKPYLGICLGLQVMVIEYSRNVLNWSGANSTEFVPQNPHPVVIFMPEVNQEIMGGTMRLGARTTVISTTAAANCSTIAAVVYGCTSQQRDACNASVNIVERHRHRYEVNPAIVADLQEAGLIFSGKDETGQRMEICELSKISHPFMLSVQFHPEFKSRPNRPSPPFYGFLAACSGHYDRLDRAGLLWQQYESNIVNVTQKPDNNVLQKIVSANCDTANETPPLIKYAAVTGDQSPLSELKRIRSHSDGDSESVKKRC